MQHLEIAISPLVGCISMTVYADWDTRLPGKLDDGDVSPDMEVLPPDRYGLIVNISISAMSLQDRHDFLKICTKCMDFYVLGETTPSIAQFRWHNEN